MRLVILYWPGALFNGCATKTTWLAKPPWKRSWIPIELPEPWKPASAGRQSSTYGPVPQAQSGLPLPAVSNGSPAVAQVPAHRKRFAMQAHGLIQFEA